MRFFAPRRLRFAAPALLLLAPAAAQALSVQMMRDSDLLQRAEGAALVEVERELPAHDGDKSTRYVLRVREVLDGPALGPVEVLALPGTYTAPNLNFRVAGIPHLAAGQDLLLVYNRSAAGSLAATELTLGMFFEVDSPAGRYYLRTVDNLPLEKAQRNAQYAAARQADRFEDWIRSQSTQPAADIDSDYLVDLRQLQGQEKYMLSQFNFGNGIPVGPGRWFEFDTDQTLTWTAGTVGQSNTPGVDEFQLLQQALAAWTNDAGSKILLSFNNPMSGTVTNVIDNTGFTGKVTWDRNLADADCGGASAPSGAFDCNLGGTLALGGSFVFSNSSDSNGTTYFPRSKALICVRLNAGCSMVGNGGQDGAELLAHEVGHTLAFAHSCNEGSAPACNSDATANDALMRPFLHGARGPTLSADDRAGAAFVYPAPVAPDVGPTVAAGTPGNGSTTPLGGGTVGATVQSQISFSVSGGSGAGTTSLTCSVQSGTVAITSNAQQTLDVNDVTSLPVGVQFTLSASSQTGTVSCQATPQGGSQANFSFTFTANAGTSPTACPTDSRFRSGFEDVEDNCN